MKEEIIKCSICDSDFDLNGEGGIAGDIGILPFALCPTCYAGVLDMAQQIMCPFCEGYQEEDDEHNNCDNHCDN